MFLNSFRRYAQAFNGLSSASWMLAVVMLINRSGSMVLPFLGVYMVDHLHFSLADSGLVLGCFGLGSVLGSLLGGWLTDRLGSFSVQVFSLLSSVLMFCLLPLFTTVASLAGMILLQSVLSELFRPANSVAITEYARPENLTRAFSLNRMAVNLGFSIGPAVGGLLSAVSYDFLFYANALAALLAALTYIYFFGRKQKRQQPKSARPVGDTGATKDLSPWRNTPFLLFCFFCLVFSVCFFQLLNTLPLFYKEAAGLTQQEIGLLLGFSGLVVVLLEMQLVQLAERRLSIAQTMLIGCLLCAVSYGILGFTHWLPLLFLSIVFLSCGEILILPFMATITAQAAGQHNKGRYMGLNGMAVAVSFVISPLLGSTIAQRYGFSFLWIATTVILILVAIAFYRSTPTLGKKP